MEVYMNTFKKLTFAALILGAGTQTINAHPWTTKAIAAATLTGLGLGYGTIKYYGFNTVTNAVLEKCANAKNWFSNKLSDAVFGSYKKQIAQLRDAHTKHLVEVADEQAILKEEIREVLAENNAKIEAKEADRKDAHERAISLTKQIISKNEVLKNLKTEQERIEGVMRGTIAGISGRSGVLETEKRAVIAQNSKLQDEIAAQAQEIANLQETIIQLQAQLAQLAPQAPSDVQTSDSSIASTDAEDVKAEEGFELI